MAEYRQLEELNEMIGRMFDERAADHERYLREREVSSAAVIELERLAQAIQSIVERMKNRIAGITPDGLPPAAPPTAPKTST